VHQPAPLLEPGIHRLPRHLHEPRGFRHRPTRQIADDINREGVGQRLALAVHQQDAFGVEHRVIGTDRLYPARVRLDINQAGGDLGREPTGALGAERAVSGDQAHVVSPLPLFRS